MRRRQCRPWLAAAVLVAGLAGAARAGPPPAPGYADLAYAPPAPGSYSLPVLFDAADLSLRDAAAGPLQLRSLLHDRLVLLSFVYSGCSDVNGCPLALHVLRGLAARLEPWPELAANLRLVSVSFDPVRDSPEAFADYGRHLLAATALPAGLEWRFLTLASVSQLDRLADSYGQSVVADPGADADGRGFSHLLRVYLIDPRGRVRNVYGVSYLHPDLLINDLLTLANENDAAGAVRTTAAASDWSGPGDDRSGYAQGDYRTRSRDLSRPQGRRADLLTLATDPPLGLPALPLPPENPLSAARIELGRKLFFDRRLSHNGTLSCAMCHVPEQGFTSNEMATAVGVEGRSVRRNTPTLYNVGYAQRLFHDGREDSLEQQVWGPLLARNEMANVSVGQVLGRLRELDDYQGLFERAFAGRGPDMLTLGQALASYQRTLVSADSPFDRWYYGGDASALDEAAQRGFGLFRGRAACAQCHSLGAGSALFTDHRLHNTGVGYRQSMPSPADRRKLLVAPGIELEVDAALLESLTGPSEADLGLYEVTEDPADRWKYRTPGLRNVALTAPYMHNGSLPSLEAVVDYYDAGGVAHDLLDPRIRPLGLSADEKADLVAFLRALTGSNVAVLVGDALAAPVGDQGVR